MSNSFLYRVKIYLAERFPLPLTISSSLLGMVGLYLVWLATTPGAAVRFSVILPFAFLTFFLFTFILRCFDELKDREVDQTLFPDRLLVKGEVLYEDIHKLLIGTLFIWIPMNFIVGDSPYVFTALCLYAFLFYKYFFIPKVLSKNILLALVTHNPVMYLASFYICTLFSAEQGLPKLTLSNFLIALVFWVPSIAWETSRKIRAPEDENEYQTYSKLVGPRLATMIPVTAVLIQAFALHILASNMNLHLPLRLVGWSLFVIYAGIAGAFVFSLNRKIANSFRQVTEAHILLFSLAVALIAGLESFA